MTLFNEELGDSIREAHRVKGPGDEWETPPALFARMNRLCFELTGKEFRQDVCASADNFKIGGFWSMAEDALAKSPEEWRDRGPCWMNPPYSDPGPWLKRAHATQDVGGVVFSLIPLSAETKYFRGHVTGAAESILILSRRIRFVGATASAKGPNVIALYRTHLGNTQWIPFDISNTEAGKV